MKPEIYDEFVHIWTTEIEKHFLIEGGRVIYNAHDKTGIFIEQTRIWLEVVEQMKLHGNRVARDREEADLVYKDGE